eukprot:scaffold323165_cov18-Tisochrysis_lutea.AAC.1
MIDTVIAVELPHDAPSKMDPTVAIALPCLRHKLSSLGQSDSSKGNDSVQDAQGRSTLLTVMGLELQIGHYYLRCVMGRQPQGFACLPVELTPGCPGPPSAPPILEFWLPSQAKCLGSPAVSEGRRRQWL